MDLTNLDTAAASQKAQPLYLRHPSTRTVLGYDPETGSYEKASVIFLLGSEAPAYRREVATRANIRQRSQRARGKNYVPTEDDILEAADKIEQDEAYHLAAITTGWSNIELDGEPLEFTRENAVKLYQRFSWIKQQASAFSEDSGNYLGNG